jgi:hypothetical protein
LITEINSNAYLFKPLPTYLHQNCKKKKYICENINKIEKIKKNVDFVYHLKIFDGTEDMGLCPQSQILYRMQLEL